MAWRKRLVVEAVLGTLGLCGGVMAQPLAPAPAAAVAPYPPDAVSATMASTAVAAITVHGASPPRATEAALQGAAPRFWSAAQYTARGGEMAGLDGLDFNVEFVAFGPTDPSARRLLDSIPAVRLGWRYRMRDQAVLVARRPDLLSSRLADTTVTHVGIQWKPAPSQIDLLRGGIGLRLQGAEHMSIRFRKGSFGLYFRRKF